LQGERLKEELRDLAILSALKALPGALMPYLVLVILFLALFVLGTKLFEVLGVISFIIIIPNLLWAVYLGFLGRRSTFTQK